MFQGILARATALLGDGPPAAMVLGCKGSAGAEGERGMLCSCWVLECFSKPMTASNRDRAGDKGIIMS